jgi:hypothetical protein
MISYSTALLLTLGIECLVVAVFKLVVDKDHQRSASPPSNNRISFPQWMVVVVGVNLLSHPIAWTVVSADVLSFYWVELFVIGIEAVIFRVLLVDSNSKAIAISLAANLASMLVGFAIS